jgi:hypothetical protein
VLGERQRVAVVEVQPERSSLELIGELLADPDQAGADAGRSIDERGVDAVKVDRVRMRARVDEADLQQVAFARAQRRPGNAPVVCPRGVLDTRHDLDLLVGGDQLPPPQRPAAREPTRRAPVEVAQHGGRVEAVDLRVDRRGG